MEKRSNFTRSTRAEEKISLLSPLIPYEKKVLFLDFPLLRLYVIFAM